MKFVGWVAVKTLSYQLIARIITQKISLIWQEADMITPFGWIKLMEHRLNYLSLDWLIIWILVLQYKDWFWYQTFSWSEKKICQLSSSSCKCLRQADASRYLSTNNYSYVYALLTCPKPKQVRFLEKTHVNVFLT